MDWREAVADGGFGVAALAVAGLVFGAGCGSCQEEVSPEDVAGPETGVDAAVDASDTDGAELRADTDDVAEAGSRDAGDTGGDLGDGGSADAGDAAPETGDTGEPAAVCGDGVVEGNEACDDGNTSDGDYCSGDCSTVTGRCGDGTLQSNESCDDGQITSNCDTYHDGGDGTCQPPGQCSSGYVWDGSSCVPKMRKEHVHISITNTCKLSVQPQSLTVQPGQTVQPTYHNHSRSYSADVIYSGGGGGFYDLMPGQSWTSLTRCRNVNRPYTVHIEITVHGFPVDDSRCPGHRFEIHCTD